MKAGQTYQKQRTQIRGTQGCTLHTACSLRLTSRANGVSCVRTPAVGSISYMMRNSQPPVNSVAQCIRQSGSLTSIGRECARTCCLSSCHATCSMRLPFFPPPDAPTPRGIPGIRSQDTKRADGLHEYPSALVYEDQPLPSSTVVQPAAQEVTLVSLIEKHAAAHPLKVKLLSEHAVLPTRGRSGSAGFDLYVPRAVSFAPDQQEKILVDLAVELPPLTCRSIRDRLGNAIKHRLRLCGGLVD